MKEDVKFETIGDLEPFSNKLKETIAKTKELTKNNKSLTQVLALNYGAQDELLRAINKICQSSSLPVTKESLEEALDTSYSDIDLLIRTSGEQRVSNFLLWQIAYAEFKFSDSLWPDFNTKELESIINNYKNRERKFGAV
jgi:undecaprenyl diphosphate synthase